MKKYKHTRSAPELLTLPYIYGRHTDPSTTTGEQRIALFQPETVYDAELEQLKNDDPDSYRMVIYSWG